MNAVAPWVRPAPTPVAAAADLVTGHQFRFKAGVPGCSCGEEFTAGGQPPLVLHALHLAPLAVDQVLAAAASALRRQLPTAEAEAAVSVLAGMVRDDRRSDERLTDGRH